MSVESDGKWTWGFLLFVVFVIASGVLIYLIEQKMWTGFFPVCFAIGSCLGGVAGLIVYAAGAGDSFDQDDLLKSAGLGFVTWLLTTLLLPIAVVVLAIVVIFYLLSQSDSGSSTKKYRKTAHAELDFYEQKD